ncbi:MAG: MCE family protein [Bacteroidales bacterium]|nr:MCE family protein [Bacteroidales bacterium]
MEKFRMTRLQAIGLFVLLTLIATFAVINFLRGEDLFNRSNTYYANFGSVDGLAVTGPVYLKGLKVGMVEGIGYDAQKDEFEVEFKVKSQFNIPANSVAEIYSADIMGARALRINLGDSKDIAQGGDTIGGNVVPDMVTALTGELAPLKEQASKLIENMNTTLESINRLLDSTAREDLQGSFANLNRTLSNAASLSSTLNEISPELKKMVADLTLLSDGLGKSAGDIQGSLANVNEITSQLSEAELGAAVASLRSLLDKLQDPNGSVGKLLATDSLHQAVNDLINDVDKLVQRITENPKKYIKVSVF